MTSLDAKAIAKKKRNAQIKAKVNLRGGNDCRCFRFVSLEKRRSDEKENVPINIIVSFSLLFALT
jgi:hypothetical protein